MAELELSDLDLLILDYMHQHRGYHSPYEIGRHVGADGRTVAAALERMAAAGLVRKSLATPVYGITEKGRAIVGEEMGALP
ncbi:MAG: hypothetical protein D6759_08985 [Chloroflexi bacterium]|nr:MAG: hypothetical protein D6759_08985 [Chloroflexota bacterium]